MRARWTVSATLLALAALVALPAMAEEVAAQQRQLVRDAIMKVLGTAGDAPDTILLSGEGSFLGQQVIGQLELAANLVSLDDVLGPPLATVAPAFVVAVLASEELFA